MSAGIETSSTPRELGWIAEVHEQAQQACLRIGGRIRTLLRQRDDGAAAPPDEVERELLAIRRGESDGPVPALGRAYRRNWEQEREMAELLSARLQGHPAWPWLRQLQGMTPALAGRLLARLDVTRAATPSAFWAFCGLATVPGIAVRCAACGHSDTYPAGRPIDPAHHRPGTDTPCPGPLQRAAGAAEEVRVAQPRPGRGERPAYDRSSKAVCYQIGNALLRAAGPYQRYYRRERGRLDETRPHWDAGRKHLTALRKMEKLFLAHLWLVWREALELPVTQPHAQSAEGAASPLDPWQMVGTGPRRRWSRAEGQIRARPSRA